MFLNQSKYSGCPTGTFCLNSHLTKLIFSPGLILTVHVDEQGYSCWLLINTGEWVEWHCSDWWNDKQTHRDTMCWYSDAVWVSNNLHTAVNVCRKVEGFVCPLTPISSRTPVEKQKVLGKNVLNNVELSVESHWVLYVIVGQSALHS